MQTQDIQTALDQMVRDLTERGAVDPEASFSLRANEQVEVCLSCTNDMFYGRDFKFFFIDTPEDALPAAQAYISKLPDPRTVKRRAWQKTLGGVIDEGHELALSLAPALVLLSATAALTTNATHGKKHVSCMTFLRSARLMLGKQRSIMRVAVTGQCAKPLWPLASAKW